MSKRRHRHKGVIEQQVDEACRLYPLCEAYISELVELCVALIVTSDPSYYEYSEASELRQWVISKALYNTSHDYL